jgi:hypothetical protein
VFAKHTCPNLSSERPPQTVQKRSSFGFLKRHFHTFQNRAPFGTNLEINDRRREMRSVLPEDIPGLVVEGQGWLKQEKLS